MTLTVKLLKHQSSTFNLLQVTVSAGSVDARPAPLPPPWPCAPVVRPDDGTQTASTSSAGHSQPPVQPPTGVAVGMKQMSWLSGFLATANPRSAASARTWVFVEVTEREERARQLVGVQHAEHVRLVLGCVDRPVQLATRRALDDLRVVPGGDGIEPLEHRLVEQARRTRPLVAAQARVRVRPAAYSAAKSSTTSRSKRLARSQT